MLTVILTYWQVAQLRVFCKENKVDSFYVTQDRFSVRIGVQKKYMGKIRGGNKLLENNGLAFLKKAKEKNEFFTTASISLLKKVRNYILVKFMVDKYGIVTVSPCTMKEKITLQGKR